MNTSVEKNIPGCIKIRTYEDMRNTINWAVGETEERRIQIADAIFPPRYNLDTLHIRCRNIWKIYNALSGAEITFDYEKKLFDIYYLIFEKGRELEKRNEIARALDYYLLVVLNCCPTGTLYYERPAILLEKQKRYILALMMCDLCDRAYYMAHRSMVVDIEHRRRRLERKIKNESCDISSDEYPLRRPPLPEPWFRGTMPDLDDLATHLAAWMHGEAQDSILESDFQEWQKKNTV